MSINDNTTESESETNQPNYEGGSHFFNENNIDFGTSLPISEEELLLDSDTDFFTFNTSKVFDPGSEEMTSRGIPKINRIKHALGLTPDEYADYCSLSSFSRSPYDFNAQMLKNLHFSTEFFMSSLQWKNVIYESIYLIATEQSHTTDIIMTQEQFVSIVDELSMLLLDLFSILFMKKTKQIQKDPQILKIKGELLNQMNIFYCIKSTPLEKKEAKKNSRILTSELNEVIETLFRDSPDEIFNSAAKANWDPFLIAAVKKRLGNCSFLPPSDE